MRMSEGFKEEIHMALEKQSRFVFALECNKRPALFLSMALASVGSWQNHCPQSFIKSCCVKEGFGCLRVWALGVPITTGPLHVWDSRNSRGDHAMLWLTVFLLLAICQAYFRIMFFILVISNAYVVVLRVGLCSVRHTCVRWTSLPVASCFAVSCLGMLLSG